MCGDMLKHLYEKLAVYQQNYQAGDYAAAAALYAEDARIFYPGGDLRIGRDAATNVMTDFAAKGVKRIDAKMEEVMGKHGDEFVTARGHYEAIGAAGEVIHQGKYITMFKLIAGDYLIYLDTECA